MDKVWTFLKFAAIPVVWWILENPEKYEKAKANFIKPLIKGHKKLQKFFLNNSLQGRINSFHKGITKEIGEKQKYRIKIEWINKSDVESFFRKNELIVKMDCKDNINRNLSLATLVYISRTLIRKTRSYIDPILNEAIDLMATKKILEEEGEVGEKSYYNDVFLFPKLESSDELKSDCKKIEYVDRKGIFTRLFLRELYFLGELLESTIPTEEVKKEVRDFLLYIETLSKTPLLEKGQSVYLTEDEEWKFKRRYLKIQFLLFAKSENVALTNIRPYRRRMKDGLREGVDIFYLLANKRSLPFFKLVEKDIIRRFVRHRILKQSAKRDFFIQRSDRGKEKIRCIIYRRLRSFKDVKIDDILEEVDEKNGEKEAA